MSENQDRLKGDDCVVDNSVSSKYVALLPAAGTGTRLPDRKMSKELLRFGAPQEGGTPVISHLLGCVQRAGIEKVIIVLRNEKTDIPAYLAGHEWQEIDFTYRMTPGTSGVPETVALGLQDAGSQNVVFGFPDILFEPQSAYVDLIHKLENTSADVVLGLFPTNSPNKMDMVDLDEDGRIIRIDIKPTATSLTLTWILAVWQPTFSTYLTDLVHQRPGLLQELATGTGSVHLGHAFQTAMADGLALESVTFEHGRSLDIGTPDDLIRAQSWESGGSD